MEIKSSVHIVKLPILCVITTLVAMLLNFQDPFWSVITVIVLYTGSNIHPLQKALLRTLGTTLGAILGLVVCFLFADQSLMKLIAIFLITSSGAYCSRTHRYHYAWLLASATAFLVILTSWNNDQLTVSVAVWRSIEIILGVIVIFLDSLVSQPKQTQQPTALADNPMIWHYCIKVGISCLVTSLVFLWSHWEGAAIGVISAFVISSQKDYSQLLSKGLQRFFGCAAGAAIGIICKVTFSQTLFSLLLIIFMITAVYALLHFYNRNNPYAKLQAIVAFLIALLPSSNQLTQDISPALARVSGIFLGVAIAMIINYIVWPKAHQTVTNRLTT